MIFKCKMPTFIIGTNMFFHLILSSSKDVMYHNMTNTRQGTFFETDPTSPPSSPALPPSPLLQIVREAVWLVETTQWSKVFNIRDKITGFHLSLSTTSIKENWLDQNTIVHNTTKYMPHFFIACNIFYEVRVLLVVWSHPQNIIKNIYLRLKLLCHCFWSHSKQTAFITKQGPKRHQPWPSRHPKLYF